MYDCYKLLNEEWLLKENLLKLIYDKYKIIIE